MAFPRNLDVTSAGNVATSGGNVATSGGNVATSAGNIATSGIVTGTSSAAAPASVASFNLLCSLIVGLVMGATRMSL